MFGHALLLTRQADEMGQPEYTLEPARPPCAEAFSEKLKPSDWMNCDLRRRSRRSSGGPAYGPGPGCADCSLR